MPGIVTHPAEVDAGVDFILQHKIEMLLGKWFVPVKVSQDSRIIEMQQHGAVAAAGHVQLKNLPGHRAGDGIDLVVLGIVHAVAEGDVAAKILAVSGQMFVGHDNAVRILLPLQLGEGCQEIKHHPAGGGGSVDGLCDGNQCGAGRGEDVLDHREGIAEGAGKTVQLPDNDGCDGSGGDRGEHLPEGGPIRILAGESGILKYSDGGLPHGGIATQDLALSLDGNAVDGLLIGRDTAVAVNHNSSSFPKTPFMIV